MLTYGLGFRAPQGTYLVKGLGYEIYSGRVTLDLVISDYKQGHTAKILNKSIPPRGECASISTDLTTFLKKFKTLIFNDYGFNNSILFLDKIHEIEFQVDINDSGLVDRVYAKKEMPRLFSSKKDLLESLA
ncbi:hypothetical protein [Edaphovirga cremea]|uniref:hypothetical protein n=1 Tax=Edaphovirga cremea TaxID=2267246 RepID=UPI000DEF79A6|nr:hypothetical protein [Edaphovirga cremea]